MIKALVYIHVSTTEHLAHPKRCRSLAARLPSLNDINSHYRLRKINVNYQGNLRLLLDFPIQEYMNLQKLFFKQEASTEPWAYSKMMDAKVVDEKKKVPTSLQKRAWDVKRNGTQTLVSIRCVGPPSSSTCYSTSHPQLTG